MRPRFRTRQDRSSRILEIPTILIVLLGFAAESGARPAALELRPVSVELPAAPSAILPADLDGDGHQDLVVALAYTEWDQLGIEESAEMDGVEGLVEVLTIVPALTDRREVRFFRGDGHGDYEDAGTLALERSVLSLFAGPPGMPIVALTDRGVAALRWRISGELVLEAVIEDRPVIAGSGAFIPDLGLLHDLDGDGRGDLLFPADDGVAIYLAIPGGLASRPAARRALPADRRSRFGMVRHVPLPVLRDVDGDRLPDLLLPHHPLDWGRFHVLRNGGGGRLAAAAGPLVRGELGGDEVDGGEYQPDDDTEFVYFGDLDGDGVAEYVTQRQLGDDDAGWRQEMKEAKNPPFLYRFHKSRKDFTVEPEPYFELEAVGYAFDTGDEDELRIPGGFQDLDGDGRLDLVALTLDFSILQAVRILTVKRISVGLDFHLWCQGDDGRLRPVRGLDLSGKFRLDLNNLRLGQLSQFAGDFDGDGRADFVQIGRGRKVTIHRGREGCFYPADPDATIELAEAPRDLSLARVEDLDGDGLTDLLVIQPQRRGEPGVSRPVRLDLYLSGDEE
ncbi:MAG: VCBS repeat-containing protein [Thermoanaerobaculia bacterium]